MQGAAPHETPEQVRAFWELFAESQRKVGRPFKLTRSRKRLAAYVSDGRWVADCPECRGGVGLWRENEEACCLDCGHVYSSIDWPDASEVDEAERVLAARPTTELHWRPDSGETVDDLKVENLKHGYPPVSG